MKTELLAELKDLVFDSPDMLALVDMLDLVDGLVGTNKLLLAELKAAHQIIRIALNLMTPAQKRMWAERNSTAGLIEHGTTRANEREAVIEKAEQIGITE